MRLAGISNFETLIKPQNQLTFAKIRLCFHILLKIYPGKDSKMLAVKFCSPNKALLLGRCSQTTDRKLLRAKASSGLSPRGALRSLLKKYVLSHLSLIYNLLVLLTTEYQNQLNEKHHFN